MGRQRTTERHVTMTDIADACGLSHATVSFVLRGRLDKPVSTATRERVFAAAVQMRYQPQRHHRIDAGKLRVLFVCPEYNVAYGVSSYPGRVMAELARRHTESRVEFSLMSTERQSMMETLWRGVCEGLADAVVITRVTEHEVREVCAHCPVPVVQMGTSVQPITPCVSLDDYAVGRQAGEYLWAQGHRHVGILGIETDLGHLRANGLRDVWKERSGGQLDPFIWTDQFDERGGIVHGQRFMAMTEPKPTALFALTDTIAYGMMRVLFEHGKTVPDHVSLIGCDNTPFSQVCCPPLTSFELCEGEVAEHLIRLLRKACLGEGGGEEHVSIRPRLVIRESVRRLPA